MVNHNTDSHKPVTLVNHNTDSHKPVTLVDHNTDSHTSEYKSLNVIFKSVLFMKFYNEYIEIYVGEMTIGENVFPEKTWDQSYFRARYTIVRVRIYVP